MMRKMISRMKASMSSHQKEAIRNLAYRAQAALVFVRFRRRFRTDGDKPKILYCLTPEHNNIGDMAIVCGTYCYFQKEFPGWTVLEFSAGDVRKYQYILRSIARRQDLVFLHGGGNLGDWYPEEETVRQSLIKLLKNSKIISLPQTVSFGNGTDTEWLRRAAEKTYTGHKDFRLICRDWKSHQFAQAFLPGVVSCRMPDMALNMPQQTFPANRCGILLCLRGDIEKKRSREFDSELLRICKSTGNRVEYTDTVADAPISKAQREALVQEKIALFGKSKIVITDRYHGIIFAYLSQTPCIAISSADHKVRENCRYFTECGFIRWADNLAELEEILRSGFEKQEKRKIDFYGQYFKHLKPFVRGEELQIGEIWENINIF